MNKYFDDSRLGEKLIDIILPLEIVYKEDKGEPLAAQLRHGRLDDDLYVNRKIINTRYGMTPIIPQVKIYFRAFTDDDSVITIDIFNNAENSLFKKFVIKSKNNKYQIKDMKNICDDIITILTMESEVAKTEIDETEIETNENKDGKIIKLINYIKNKKNLIFAEIAQ